MVKRILFLTIVLVAVAGAGSWWWLRQSLPLLDGELRVDGLTAPVEVVFDGHGVPHVYASGPEDAWFAAGVLHARDRLWQMELYRRAASGRLSEILGEETLPVDRRFLTLRLRDAAEAEWRATTPSVRQALTRYAEGVNAQMAAAGGWRRPIELQVLGVTPAAWTPVDSLAVGRLLSWRLAENHQAELVRHAIASEFGVAEALRLAGRYPAGAPSVIQGASANAPDEHVAVEAGAPVRRSGSASSERIARRTVTLPPGLGWLHPSARRGGSNNWVIAGKRTVSGRPLLANDPHLQLEFPGLWYEMHLVAADLDVIGVTVPGSPFVIIGHNTRVAWGLTNTGADVQDLFVERLNLERRHSLHHGQWRPVDVSRADIPVRGGDPVPFEIWRTPNGTVFADVGLEWSDAPEWLSPAVERHGERRAYALRWEGIDGETAAAFEAINRAAGWDEFVAAVERFAAPSQNFVYADIEGNIGYAMSGVLPQRAGSVGSMPQDGNAGAGQWVGRVPTAALPRLFNPERGYITSSNNLIDREWRGLITRDWAAPYRALRLQRLMDASDRVDIATAAEWQNDVTGLAAADVLLSVDAALALAGREGEQDAADVLQQLRAWDRRIDNRPVVTLYQLFEAALWRRTFFDEMGDPLFESFYEWAGAERPSGLYALLSDAHSRWFDDIATLGRRETRDHIYVLAATDAAIEFRTVYGTDAPWAAVHGARFVHPLSGGVAPIRWLFNRGPVAVAGDAYTVNRASYNRLRPFAAWEIPSWRQIFDVGQWDQARVVLPTGQSGHPLSPHFFDQNEMWRQGQYRQQPFSRRAVEAARTHRLLLVP